MSVVRSPYKVRGGRAAAARGPSTQPPPCTCIHFSWTRVSKFFSPGVLSPVWLGRRGRAARSKPPRHVRGNSRGGLSLPSGAGVHPGEFDSEGSSRPETGRVRFRHVTPTRRVSVLESSARRMVFGRLRSISPRRCSLPALSVAARETSHLEANASTAIFAGMGIRANPRAGPCANRINLRDRSPLVTFGPASGMG